MGLVSFKDCRRVLEQVDRVRKQIVEIHGLLIEERFPVSGIYLDNLLLVKTSRGVLDLFRGQATIVK